MVEVPKSTLSYWLRDIAIAPELRKRINRKASNAGREALIRRNKKQTQMALLRNKRTSRISKKEISKITMHELKLIGTALYFGEGGKTGTRVDFTNSDPGMIRVAMKYFRRICRVKEPNFRIQLSIADGNNSAEAIRYWERITQLPASQFIKVNTRISKYSKKKRKNKLPYGTIQIRISNVELFHRIDGWTRGLIQRVDNMPG